MLSEQTLPQLAEGVISLHEQGFVVDATLSTGVDWDSRQTSKFRA